MFSLFLKKTNKKEPNADSQPLNMHEKELFSLIESLNFDAFKQVFESEDVNPNTKGPQGSTLLLHTAVNDNKFMFTQFLLEKGADINTVGQQGYNALFAAVYWNSIETVKLLLSTKKANLDESNEAFGFKLNPVSAAIYKDHYEIAKLLLYHGADPFKAERFIIEIEVISKAYTEKYSELLEFYKRWHKGKKQILLALHLAKNKKDEQVTMKKLKPFDVSLLSPQLTVRIADEFL